MTPKALISVVCSCSRMISVRRSMQNIPKLHIPIKEQNLPKVKEKEKENINIVMFFLLESLFSNLA